MLSSHSTIVGHQGLTWSNGLHVSLYAGQTTLCTHDGRKRRSIGGLASGGKRGSQAWQGRGAKGALCRTWVVTLSDHVTESRPTVE